MGDDDDSDSDVDEDDVAWLDWSRFDDIETWQEDFRREDAEIGAYTSCRATCLTLTAHF
jgi:hypothetical protein